MEISNIENNEPEFKKIIAGYSDNELKNVLRKRALYQKEAADFAVQEAIRRGLIYSEQDLFAREFKMEPEKFSVFPSIENNVIRARYRKSITRALIIIGALPMVWGGVKIFETQNLEGILIFIFGVAWSLISFQLLRSVKLALIYLMFFLLALWTAYLVKMIISARTLIAVDILMAVLAVGIVFYFIGFLGKLKD